MSFSSLVIIFSNYFISFIRHVTINRSFCRYREFSSALLLFDNQTKENKRSSPAFVTFLSSLCTRQFMEISHDFKSDHLWILKFLSLALLATVVLQQRPLDLISCRINVWLKHFCINQQWNIMKTWRTHDSVKCSLFKCLLLMFSVGAFIPKADVTSKINQSINRLHPLEH